MDYLSQLVKLENSKLSEYLKYHLYGLRASLEVLEKINPEDPGINLCHNLLIELDRILQESNSEINDSTEKLLKSDQSELLLQDFSHDFFDDQNICLFIEDLHPKSDTDSKLWDEIHKVLLRVPESIAQEWQQKAVQAVQNLRLEANWNREKAVILPCYYDKPLYPSLGKPINAKGLYLSTKAPLDLDFNTDNLPRDQRTIAQIVSICIHFIETDPSLNYCLKSINKFGIFSFNSKQKSQYIKHLIILLKRVQKYEAQKDFVNSFKARINLDEAINSLVYKPLAAPNSWWGKLQQDARNTLNLAVQKVHSSGHKNAGYQWLQGDRDNVIDYTEQGDDIHYRSKTKSTPGKVLACLRVYAWIDEEKIKGRVIFYPR